MLLQIRKLDEGSAAIRDMTFVGSFSCVQSSVLLNMRQLLEPSFAVGAFVWFFPCVNPDVLNQLMVTRKGFEALLTLMRLDFRSTPDSSFSTQLHRRLGHQILPVIIVRIMIILLPKMVWGVVVLWVVVIISWSAVLHLASSTTPLHPFHPLLGRAGQDRLSEHRHLGPQGPRALDRLTSKNRESFTFPSP